MHILNFPALGSAEFPCLRDERVWEFQKKYTYYSLPYLYSTYFGFSSKENFQNFSALKLALFVTSFTHKVTITQVFFYKSQPYLGKIKKEFFGKFLGNME